MISSKRSFKSILICLGYVANFFFFSLHAASTTTQHQEIHVPLGFNWGDSPQKLEEAARPGGFTITHREEFSDRTIITVHGLIGTALEENLFTFRKGELVEIEYRYGDKNWNVENYQDFFDAFRRMYDVKYGAATQLINTASKKPDRNGVFTSLVGYQWSQASCVLELFYFTAEQPDEHASRLISLHYKAP